MKNTLCIAGYKKNYKDIIENFKDQIVAFKISTLIKNEKIVPENIKGDDEASNLFELDIQVESKLICNENYIEKVFDKDGNFLFERVKGTIDITTDLFKNSQIISPDEKYLKEKLLSLQKEGELLFQKI